MNKNKEFPWKVVAIIAICLFIISLFVAIFAGDKVKQMFGNSDTKVAENEVNSEDAGKSEASNTGESLSLWKRACFTRLKWLPLSSALLRCWSGWACIFTRW